MKILPSIRTKLDLSKSLANLPKRIRFALSHDTVEISAKKYKYKELSLETFKKLANISYTPSRIEGYDSTFVIDKSTGKPITVYVEKDLRKTKEIYNFYVKNDKTDDLNLVGYRIFKVNESDKKITPGIMVSYKNDKYLGLGIREHQVAVERMLQKGCSNVVIFPINKESKLFHVACGFNYVENLVTMQLTPRALKEWSNFINCGQRILN